MSEYQQNRVSQVVWPWVQAGKSAKKSSHLPRPVRAAIQAAVMAVISGVLYHFKPDHFMWKFVAGFAVVVLISGVAVPPLFQALERFGQWLGKVVAVSLTWGLLVPFFYLVFIPGRILFGLSGKDPMARACPTKLETYWIPRPPVRDMNQYKKQH